MTFVGRARELTVLDRMFAGVREGSQGAMAALRGRRQVGKSTLVERFCDSVAAPAIFFTATRYRDSAVELDGFVKAAAASLGAPQLDASFHTWDAALSAVAGAARNDAPLIIVIDEFPWLLEGDRSVEGAIQTAWDRTLRRLPILMILIGSDLAMMDALTEYGRPLYDRVRQVRVDPLAPSEVAELVGQAAVDVLDLYLVVGGFPNLVRLAVGYPTIEDLLRTELEDPTSPLIVAGERSLNAEFPDNLPARQVLEAIGAGGREHKAAASRAGVAESTLNRALETLVDKRAVSRVRPYSVERHPRRTRYEVRDPYLRFWLRWLGSARPEIERGRGRVVADRILGDWSKFRGQAIEPIVREAVTRMLPDRDRFGSAMYIGSYWTRDGQVEVDLVGGDHETAPKRLGFVGSIKWRESAPFNEGDLRALASHAQRVPGAADASLVAVTRSGTTEDARIALAELLTPEDLLAAW